MINQVKYQLHEGTGTIKNIKKRKHTVPKKKKGKENEKENRREEEEQKQSSHGFFC